MKKIIQKLSVLALVFASGLVVTSAIAAPAYAYTGCDETSIIKVDSECSDEGGGLWAILQIVLDIMTAGVAVAAIAGISIAAFMYTSAGGNEERVKKSKDRILQVVIGILVYGILWAALQWLIPGGVLG